MPKKIIVHILNENLCKQRRLICLGIVLAIIFWVFESALHFFVFKTCCFMRSFFLPEAHELWMRMMVMSMFIFYGVYSQYLMNLRKKAEIENERVLSELSQIFQTAGDGMRVVDKDFNVIRRSATYLDLCGRQSSGDWKEKCFDEFPGELCETDACPLRRIMRGEKRIKTEVCKKQAIARIRSIKEEMDEARLKEKKAERSGDLNEVAQIRYGVLGELSKKLDAANKELVELQKDKAMLKEEVDEGDIAKIVSKWTGIPLTKLMEAQTQKLISMEGHLRERVVGQDEALRLVSDCIRRSRTGLSDQNRPLGSFIFIGSTGVGKTELAKSLAWFLFDDENALIRMDMSEYMEKHSVSRLIGAPPGYVGYDEGGQLTEKVRRRPYSVVLFDEIEKAHPDVFNVLLQILDDGRLTDGQGRVINFKNTVIIMTSNLGTELFNESKDESEVEPKILERLKKEFRPEFLNRIDEVIIFRKLKEEDIEHIVDIQLAGFKKKLEAKHILLSVSKDAKMFLSKEGYDSVYGARPLKRLIQKKIQDVIALALLKGEFKEYDKINITAGKKGLEFKTERRT